MPMGRFKRGLTADEAIDPGDCSSDKRGGDRQDIKEVFLPNDHVFVSSLQADFFFDDLGGCLGDSFDHLDLIGDS